MPGRGGKYPLPPKKKPKPKRKRLKAAVGKAAKKQAAKPKQEIQHDPAARAQRVLGQQIGSVGGAAGKTFAPATSLAVRRRRAKQRKR